MEKTRGMGLTRISMGMKIHCYMDTIVDGNC